MELYGMHFEYNNIMSVRYGLVLANVDTSRFSGIIGDTQTVSIHNKRNHNNYYVNDDLSSSAISFDVDILSEENLSVIQQREIERWLFYYPGYAPLYFEVSDDYNADTYEIVDGSIKRFYLNCRLINPKKLEYNGGIVGYSCTVECDSAAAWEDTITKTFQVNVSGSIGSSVVSSTLPDYQDIVVNVNNDLRDYVYPVVRITTSSSTGAFSIANQTDDASRLTQFDAMPASLQFYMDGSTNYVSTSSGSGNTVISYYDNMVGKNFVRLVDGANTLRVRGHVSSITVEWKNRRYL